MPVQESGKNKKSCILTESGREKLSKALAEKYPNGPNASELALLSGKDRAVISKILNPQECKAVTHKSLDELFSCLGIDLEDDDFKKAEKKPKPHHSEKPQVSRQNKNPAINVNHKVAELLCLLNCAEQEEKFRNTIRCHKGGVFLVQANKKILQNWLVYRLAKCIQDFGNAEKFSIKINLEVRINFNNFWKEFKKLDSEDNLNRETVIQRLAEFCKTKSVIIVIDGFSSLGSEQVHLYNFWSTLVNKVNSIPNRSFRSHLIFLLVGTDRYTVLNNDNNDNSYSEIKYKIIPLKLLEEISDNEVEFWLNNNQVYEELNQRGFDVQSFVSNKIPYLAKEPDRRLEEICESVFQIEDDITEIERYWKLV
ncbi:MAG: hypothetical protein QNJ51_15955 [Calothrix sp. MO_167.B12]|nr:hypothetical protein [Calothrix sp. MO_167.B12]